jgi:hypothetical protein
MIAAIAIQIAFNWPRLQSSQQAAGLSGLLHEAGWEPLFMSFKTLISSTVAAAITLGTAVPLSSAASARNFDRHGGGHGRHFERHVAPQQYGKFGHGYGHAPRRHRDHTGRNIAIGAFATILGLALAAESQRVHRDYYEDRD